MLQTRKFFPQFLLLDKVPMSLNCVFQAPGPIRTRATIARRHVSSTRSTVNVAEVDKFGSQSSQWWKDEFRVLRRMNALRVPLIRDGLLAYTDRKIANIVKPLAGFRILDVGCGGGLLAEPLARLGASVTGLDPSPDNIQKAVEHSLQDETLRNNLTYVCDTVENLRNNVKPFDALVCSEVVEHVDNVSYFVECCVNMVKREGSIFFTTINQTPLSFLVAIIGAEYLTRLIPRGTHQWSKFVKPEDLQSMLESLGCRTVQVQGMAFNPLTYNWSWSSSQRVSYAMHVVKDV